MFRCSYGDFKHVVRYQLGVVQRSDITRDWSVKIGDNWKKPVGKILVFDENPVEMNIKMKEKYLLRKL